MLHHHHENHVHHEPDLEGDGVWALHAEDLYLRLADQARTPLINGVPIPAAPEEPAAMRDTRQRLGQRAPVLNKNQEEFVRHAFAAHHEHLPQREQSQHHGHDHGGCGKRHGPLQRLFEKVEHTAISRVKQQRAKVAVALLFRAGLFTMCPGDDIAAIGLQVYGSVAGGQQEHHEEHSHDEVYAVLPRRPRLTVDLDNGRAVVDLPLDNAALPSQLPQNSIGDAVREHLDFTAPR